MRTLFARVLLVQVVVAVAVALLFGALVMRQQAQVLARTTAPVWAAALGSEGAPARLPRAVPVSTEVLLLPGPPPPEAVRLSLYLRFADLADELRALGVPVRELRVSGSTGQAVTWLELERQGERRWVGVAGELEGADMRQRGTLGFLAGLLVVMLGASWLTGRVVRPLRRLRRDVDRFAADVSLPERLPEDAPRELRELHSQFELLAQERRRLDEQRRLMLAGISHDLRSPLARIRVAADLLPDEADPELRASIVRNVALADRLLASFVDYARAEDEPLAGTVDVAALAADVAGSLPDVVFDPGAGQPLRVQPASAVALERALRNLLDNAQAHGRAPVILEVTARREQGVCTARLAVRDHGEGLPEAERRELVQPFRRGDRSRSTPGTGLGLALADRVARRHGGRLVLEAAHPGLRAVLEVPVTV